jgi:hypothetical protein
VIEGALHPDTVGIASGQKCGAAGRTDRLSDVEVRETSSLLGEGVEVRGPDVLSPEATEVTVAEVIDQDQHDVREPVDGMTGDASKQQD